MTKDEKNKVFMQYQKLIEAQVWKIVKRSNADHKDLQAQAYLIFCEEVDNWNPDDAALGTYLFSVIRNHLLSYVYKEEKEKTAIHYENHGFETEDQEEANEITVEFSASTNPIIQAILQTIREIPPESNVPYKSIYHGWLDRAINRKYGFSFSEIWKTYPTVKKMLKEA